MDSSSDGAGPRTPGRGAFAAGAMAGDQMGSSGPAAAGEPGPDVRDAGGSGPLGRPAPCTPREIMVVCTAREIADGELVFVGMRLPLLAFMLAKRTHAPRALALFENGVIREHPTVELLYTMGDPANLRGASQLTDLQSVMGLLQQGRVDLGILGGAQVDRYGNLNSTLVRAPDGGNVRLPGSGGGCDIACLARRTVVMMPHERHRLVARVDYLTSPGHGEGGDWRRRVGLPAGGPAAIVTDRAVLRFDAEGAAFLASRHPGNTVESIGARTGWPVGPMTESPAGAPARAADVAETAPPTVLELNILRDIDRDGFWTGERPAAGHVPASRAPRGE